MVKKNEPCQNYRLQEVVNHYAWNRPASWTLNVRQAAKIKIHIKILYSIIYPLERKQRKSPRDENDSLAYDCVWPVNTEFPAA